MGNNTEEGKTLIFCLFFIFSFGVFVLLDQMQSWNTSELVVLFVMAVWIKVRRSGPEQRLDKALEPRLGHY